MWRDLFNNAQLEKNYLDWRERQPSWRDRQPSIGVEPAQDSLLRQQYLVEQRLAVKSGNDTILTDAGKERAGQKLPWRRFFSRDAFELEYLNWRDKQAHNGVDPKADHIYDAELRLRFLEGRKLVTVENGQATLTVQGNRQLEGLPNSATPPVQSPPAGTVTPSPSAPSVAAPVTPLSAVTALYQKADSTSAVMRATTGEYVSILAGAHKDKSLLLSDLKSLTSIPKPTQEELRKIETLKSRVTALENQKSNLVEFRKNSLRSTGLRLIAQGATAFEADNPQRGVGYVLFGARLFTGATLGNIAAKLDPKTPHQGPRLGPDDLKPGLPSYEFPPYKKIQDFPLSDISLLKRLPAGSLRTLPGIMGFAGTSILIDHHLTEGRPVDALLTAGYTVAYVGDLVDNVARVVVPGSKFAGVAAKAASLGLGKLVPLIDLAGGTYALYHDVITLVNPETPQGEKFSAIVSATVNSASVVAGSVVVGGLGAAAVGAKTASGILIAGGATASLSLLPVSIATALVITADTLLRKHIDQSNVDNFNQLIGPNMQIYTHTESANKHIVPDRVQEDLKAVEAEYNFTFRSVYANNLTADALAATQSGALRYQPGKKYYDAAKNQVAMVPENQGFLASFYPVEPKNTVTRAHDTQLTDDILSLNLNIRRQNANAVTRRERNFLLTLTADSPIFGTGTAPSDFAKTEDVGIHVKTTDDYLKFKLPTAFEQQGEYHYVNINDTWLGDAGTMAHGFGESRNPDNHNDRGFWWITQPKRQITTDEKHPTFIDLKDVKYPIQIESLHDGDIIRLPNGQVIYQFPDFFDVTIP